MIMSVVSTLATIPGATSPETHSTSHEDGTPSSSETYMVGFIIANIVGLQYYSGTITGREMVGLVREPLNPYDNNAIKVLNTRGLQVGHIERTVAAVLAPLVDDGDVIIEGIVPNSRSVGNKFRIPCQIHIFSKIENFDAVKRAVSRGGLVLISDTDAGFTLSEAMVVKETRKGGTGLRNLDKIFKLVDENLKKKVKMEALEPPKEVIKSALFEHQKEGLGWLVCRENSGELPPFWEEKDGEYVNVLTNYHTDVRPEPLRGGVFADDMGLGKTLTLLSLIAFDKFGIDVASRFVQDVVASGGRTCEDDEDRSVSTSRKGKRGRESKGGSGSRKKPKKSGSARVTGDVKGKSLCLDTLGETFPEARKMTLIVCPLSVLSNWVTQLGEHTIPGKLKVYMYYGSKRTDDAKELRKYDLVLTAYPTLAAEESWKESPIMEIEWWRVILDEAHTIKNPNAQQSRAVINLKARRRWAVTGTPIQNGSLDLFSLMAFLHFEPFSIKSYWQSLIQRPLSQGKKAGLSRLQVLMSTISLRRTKEKSLTGLPPKTVETCYVDLSSEERELYDQMENEAKNAVQECIDADGFVRSYTTVLGIILRLRQICNSLALCPPDLKSLLPSNKIEDVSNNPELLKKVVEVLQDGEDFDCPICISPPTDLVITICAHMYCRSCILKTLRSSKSSCPLCRHPLAEADLFVAPEASASNDTGISKSEHIKSSKVSALLSLLIASKNENPASKSVVYSQFQKMLILLEKPLRAAGFKVLRLDGTINATKRAQVIEEFGLQAPDGPTVLLASLKASGMGINLTAASRVYLFEPWWNPAVEEQAMDRVHRIGQKEDVKIVRLIAQNSIEERVLELQDKKKKLAKEAFGRKGSKDRREVGLEDLCALMSLGSAK